LTDGAAGALNWFQVTWFAAVDDVTNWQCWEGGGDVAAASCDMKTMYLKQKKFILP